MRITRALFRHLWKKPFEPPEIPVADLTKKYANLPEKYIEDVHQQVFYRTPRGINYRPKQQKFRRPYVGVERVWSIEARQEVDDAVAAGLAPWVEPLRDWFFFVGDRVQVLFGKDKGKQGIIEMVIQERNWVIVYGLNMEIEPREDETGEVFSYVAVERPLLVNSQVALVDPGDLQPCEVEWAYTEEGDKVRVSKRTGRIIPMSKRTEETYQYKSKGLYVENEEKDTKEIDMKNTFQPKLMTFEMEIAKEMGIEEDRVPAKTFWY